MEVIGLSETLAAIQQELNKKAQQAKVAVKLAGNEYKTDVQKIAPYKTGTYRRSIHVQTIDENGQAYALVGTDLPYGKRLEFGFVGPDSLGRIFNQAPRPHFRPALDLNREKYLRIMKGTFDRNSEEMFVEGSY